MARPKPKREGKAVLIWLPPKSLDTAKQIDNLSNFVQLALSQAPGIMAWAMLHDINPEKYKDSRKIEDVVDDFNAKYPQNELTQKRTGKWPKNSPSKQELW